MPTRGDPWLPSIEIIGQQNDGHLGGVPLREAAVRGHRKLPLGRENREMLSRGGCFKT